MRPRQFRQTIADCLQQALKTSDDFVVPEAAQYIALALQKCGAHRIYLRIMLSAIQFARIEAIRSNARVTFCGAASATADEADDCADGEQPYWVVIGSDGAGGEQQLRIFAVKDPMKISTDLEKISFTADGLARDSTTKALVAGEITVCLATTNPAQNKRVLNIASGSRVIISTPPEDGGGTC